MLNISTLAVNINLFFMKAKLLVSVPKYACNKSVKHSFYNLPFLTK